VNVKSGEVAQHAKRSAESVSEELMKTQGDSLQALGAVPVR